MPTKRPSLYHNPRCTKSREALALLQEKGYDPLIIEYLKTPPTVAQLKKLINMLELPVRDILRKTEVEYKEFGLNSDNISDAKILQLIHEHPILLQRPIVIINNRAMIARPPADLNSWLHTL
jgi:arsenate reductase